MYNRSSTFSRITVVLVFVLSLSLTISFIAFAQNDQAKSNNKEQKAASEEEKLDEKVTVVDEMIGHIDWEEGYVYAVGDGVPPEDAVNAAQARVRAKRAAIDTTYARLLEMVKKVRVDAESTTAQSINESRVIRTKVQGFVKNAEIVKLKHFEDGSYQLKMRMPLNGKNSVSEAVMPSQLQKEVNKVGVAYQISQEQKQKAKAEMEKETEKSVTNGLIVDARGLDIQPAMYPRLVTSSEKIVFSIQKANPNAVIADGLVAYKPNMESAKSSSRSGNNPIVVEAIDVTGKNNADIVITEAAADKILKAELKGKFLSQAKVVVVTG